MQERLSKPTVNYSYGAYNKYDKTEQWIRLTEGCPHNCPYCYEPQEIKIFPIPKIVRNKVKIIDMNTLCKPEAIDILNKLPEKLEGKIIQYEFYCGFDYRFLTLEIAKVMKQKHFHTLRIAWDWFYKDQMKIKDALKILYDAGYNSKDVIVFMICNWDISYNECMQKADLCKVWNVKIADCYYDNQIKINNTFIPIGWTTEQAHSFRKHIRKHNQLVNFKIDPEIKP